MSKTKPKLIIIDGNALIHRSFHAIPPTLRTKDGVLVNAVYGFTSFLLKALNEFKPEFVVLTLDKAGKTFRHEEYAEYKATRIKAADELYEQIPVVKRVAKAFNIPIFEKSGYEADDLIGTICKQNDKEKNLEKIIITGDMDTLQLVNKKTKIYTMSRGLSDSILYDEKKVRERYNIDPDQIIDYKALRGDPSDNIPGVRGVGDKMATELLNIFGNLENIYRAVAKKDARIKARTIELLTVSKDDAYLSKKLATIHCQAPIKFSLADASLRSFPLNKVLNIFSELNFKSLLNKVKELRDNMDQVGGHRNDQGEIEDKFARNAKEFNYQLINSDKKFKSFIQQLKNRKSFTLDTETSGLDPITAKLLGISFSWKKGEAYFVIANEQYLKKMKPILENEKIEKSGHNLKFDWRVLKNQGINLAGLNFDTMIASYLINPGNRQHNLDSLVFSELGFEKINKKNLADSQPKQLILNFEGLDIEKLSIYSCEDADFTHRLVKIMKKKIDKEKLDHILYTMEMPLIIVLGAMENNGIKFDPKLIASLDKEVGDKLDKLSAKIHGLAKSEFNINSPKQLQEILFTKLKLSTEGIKKTKTGFSTAEDELNKLQDSHPIILLIQSYRELNKLQTTYINALPTMVNTKTKRIHTHFNQTVAATGRLSSTEPNLQNIPARTEEGTRIREAFIAEKDSELVGFDYSQIELRLAAHLANDKKMIEAFKNKADIHAATAAEINDVSLDKVSKTMRQEAKAVNFGILYGQGPHGLSQNASIPYWQASEFIKKYFLAYPQIKKMIDRSIEDARKHGHAITLFGRKRPLPDINSNMALVKRSAERMAINAPVQGTAADLIKMAMVEIYKLIQGREDEIKMILQVHDELIFEIKKDRISFYEDKIKKIMEGVIKLKVPIIVTEHKGQNWEKLK